MLLPLIEKPNDIKSLDPDLYEELCQEIRTFLIQKVSEHGGHLASNLGVVELTVALHLCMNLPEDKIVWDVGHQTYTHKILTGRREGFDTLRTFGGMSGFPKTRESDCDVFNTGHSSNSISVGLGIALARELKGEDFKVVSVIGDGALTGGMAYEALNNTSRLHSNFMIILNDNNMSISENVGGLAESLAGLRTAQGYRDLKSSVERSLEKIPFYGDRMVHRIRKTKDGIKHMVIPGMFFEDMGITYLGPVDGHDIDSMVRIFHEALRVDGPVLVHVMTKKGKGYLPAERHPARFHGTDKFDPETGLVDVHGRKSKYTDVFSTVMRKMGDRNEKVVAVTAAMADGTGLKRFSNMFPDRFFDVGIAEGHGVTFCAGLAKEGFIPVFAVYSSFLQRGFDQIVEDVCLQNLHVVFAIDRAGLVGSDGETHHGVFDISYLSVIPNMVLMAPKNKWELSDMMKFAVSYDGPIAVRYPRGEAYSGLKEYRKEIAFGKSEIINREGDVALFAYGNMVKIAEKVQEILHADGICCSLINARFAKPFDEDMVRSLAEDHTFIVTMEENMLRGGLGEAVQNFIYDKHLPLHVIKIGILDEFMEHGSVDQLMRVCEIDASSVAARIHLERKRMQGKSESAEVEIS